MVSDFPYPLLSRIQLVDAMNEASSRGEAFYVLVCFDATAGYFIPKEKADARWVRFSFDQRSLHDVKCKADGCQVDVKPLLNEKASIKPGVPNIITNWQVKPPSFETYTMRFKQVMHHIRRGDSFLTNLTQASGISTSYTLADLFALSVAPYKAWVSDRFTFFSPECFIRIEEGVIRTFPMKGTIDASLENARERILADEKEKAEHATIVDLLRNDLSMVADHVEVVRYRYIDRIQTHLGELLQVSSEIRGHLPADYRSRLGDILFAMLPAGSVSGAPKTRTLEIIEHAEGYDRGFYTGIAGYFDGENFDSAVMIRFVEQTLPGLVFKSGGGITYRSEVEQEYRELVQKVYVPLH